jgi:formate hydrogenlyase subunit 6/NADH:ubiquinone oxidoreductase subunit I
VSVCPVDPKAVQFRSSERLTPPEHHYERCIRCYCCHEMCPEGAIEIVTPPLGRLLHR